MVGLNSAFLTVEELRKFGFRKLGRDVRIHPTAVIVDCSEVSIGDHVRIDPFCVLSAKRIRIGSYVNIATGAGLLGGNEVVVEDFANVAPRTTIMTTSDDYLGRSLIGPTVPTEFRRARRGDVILRRQSVVGAGSVVLPDLIIGEGSSVGALSFVNQSLDPWGVYGGVPARRIRDRVKDVLAFEREVTQRADHHGA
jgi:dTDP-4-amino-4,6-dideoxy-D-glucose acyltransferase